MNDTHTECPRASTRTAAEATVGEASKRPGVLEILQRLGINHCCGAHLSLREAAAAAGVALGDLLRAIDEAVGDTIDVRGLEPPLPMRRVLERLEGLPEGTLLEVIHNRRPVFLYPQLDARGFAHETDEPEPGVIRIRIRKCPRSVP
jgi:TusA-related sulfurtransferase